MKPCKSKTQPDELFEFSEQNSTKDKVVDTVADTTDEFIPPPRVEIKDGYVIYRKKMTFVRAT